jgi:hypothetical protein
LQREILEQTNMQQKLFLLAALVIVFAACNNNEPQVINYFIDDNPAVVQGQLSGKFSVSPTKKVSFSQGNLQYNAAQNVWRFATNQYDYVGDATMGTVKIGTTKCNNALISNTYNGWIDLFGWGTGDNPTMSSDKSSDYPTFVDWGKNRIYNGGDKVNLWRTLTRDELVYLFHGRKDAEKKFAYGHIYLNADKTDSVNGVFLLPDSWKQPDDIKFNLTVGEDFVWNESYGEYRGSVGDEYNHNSYTLDEWAKMEANGAVFLPAAGERTGTRVSHFNEHGFVRSSTISSPSTAIYLHFGETILRPQFAYSRYFGLSVRLVR